MDAIVITLIANKNLDFLLGNFPNVQITHQDKNIKVIPKITYINKNIVSTYLEHFLEMNTL